MSLFGRRSQLPNPGGGGGPPPPPPTNSIKNFLVRAGWKPTDGGFNSMANFLRQKESQVNFDEFKTKVMLREHKANFNSYKNLPVNTQIKQEFYNSVVRPRVPRPPWWEEDDVPPPRMYKKNIEEFLTKAGWKIPDNIGFNAMHNFLNAKNTVNQNAFDKFKKAINANAAHKAEFNTFKANNTVANAKRSAFYAKVTAGSAPPPPPPGPNKRGVLTQIGNKLFYIFKNRNNSVEMRLPVNRTSGKSGIKLGVKNYSIGFKEKSKNNWNFNSTKSDIYAYISLKYKNRTNVNMGTAKWNGRALKFGNYDVDDDLTIKPSASGWGANRLKLLVNVDAAGNVKFRRPKLILNRKIPATWPVLLKGFPPMQLGVVEWNGEQLEYEGRPVKLSKLKLGTVYQADVQGSTVTFAVGETSDGYPEFRLPDSNINGFRKNANNYVSIRNGSIRYKPTSSAFGSDRIYQVHVGTKPQADWYVKKGRAWAKIYKLANGKWSMNPPPGQSGAAPPAENGAPINYKNKTWEQLINIRNTKPNGNSALNAALNAAINKQLRSVNGNSRSRKFGVYGDILIKMGSSRNYPGRGKVRDAIRTELRAALRNIRDPRRAKVELERAKANVRLSRLPTRNTNVRRAFEIEESNIKSRSREYNENYGTENNRRYGRRPPQFPPPRMPANNRYNMGPGPAPFPRNNRFRAPPSASPFRLPENAPQAPRMPNMGAPALPPPRINITNQQAFAPSPMAPPPTNQSLLANLPANERTAINSVGGVNKAANLVNQAGGGTNVAAAANALAQTGGNVERAIGEKGANEKAVKVVIQLGGGKNLNNIERAKNVLNGLNNVAVQLKKRKRRSKPKAKGKGGAKGRVAKAKPKAKTRVVYRTRPGDRVRTAELNKLLNIATKDEITKRMENADLLNKVYTKAELAKIYKKYVLGKNLPPLKKKRVLRSRAK